jgi:chitinase
MLDSLDMQEMIEGYHDGRAGWPEPGDNRTYAYWHGWRNGAVDAGHRQGDAAQMALAADYLAVLREQRKREGA